MANVAILLPVLNEADGLAWTLEHIPRADLLKAGHTIDIIVIDGHSSDASLTIAKKFGVHCFPQQGSGKGGAIREGFEQAIERGNTHLIMLDADGTYHPHEMLGMIDSLQEYDVVIGDRLNGKIGHQAMTRVNFIGNYLLSWIASLLFGKKANDVCSGYWAFRSDAVHTMNLNSLYFEIEAEMFASLVTNQLSFCYQPISYRTRIGEAKLGSTADGWMILRKLITRKIISQPHV